MQSSRSQKIHARVLLFVVLSALYLLTYRGFPGSTDEIQLFDGAESLARRGSLAATYTYDFVAYPYLENQADGEEYIAEQQSKGAVPWKSVPYEPLQPLLSAPLIWLAEVLPPVGLMHTVWLFTIFVTSLTAVVLYSFALREGYSFKVAWGGALLFGTGTMSWVYSQWLFREPLAGLFLLISVIGAIESQRRWSSGGAIWKPVVLMIGAFVAAFLTKSASIVFAPVLAVLLFPGIEVVKPYARAYRYQIAFGVGAVIVLVVSATRMTFLPPRFNVEFWLGYFKVIEWDKVGESLLGYQISPGRSFWLYSPALLLAFLGAAALWKKRQWRQPAAMALALFLFSAIYGMLYKGQWWGAMGWGPRFLVPLIPFVALGIFPGLEWIGQQGRSAVWRVLLAMLAAAGYAVQWLGLAVPLTRYYEHLNEAQIWAGDEGLWSWRWSHLPVMWREYDGSALNFAWTSGADPGWLVPAAGVLLIGFIAGWLAWNLRANWPIPERILKRANILFMGSLAALMVGGLYSLGSDSRYTGGRSDFIDLPRVLDAEAKYGDIVFLTDEKHTKLFMNYFKTPATVITLPYAPGERHNPEMTPAVISADPGEQIGPFSVWALDWGAAHYDRVWVVMGYGPFVDFALRPAEHYMVTHYFPVRSLEISQLARAILFDPTPAPQGDPAIRLGAIFGESLVLDGIDLPGGDVFRPGEVIPVSLAWSLRHKLDQDYNISVQLVTGEGIPVVQRDGLFQDTFGHTSHWETGKQYRDNHGLIVPENLAPGSYMLQAVVYDWQSGERLTFSGHMFPEGDVLVLTGITIRP